MTVTLARNRPHAPRSTLMVGSLSIEKNRESFKRTAVSVG